MWPYTYFDYGISLGSDAYLIFSLTIDCLCIASVVTTMDLNSIHYITPFQLHLIVNIDLVRLST